MTLDEAHDHVGRKVVYRPYPSAPPEEGVVTSVNTAFVFVRYGDDVHSKATLAAQLEPVRRSVEA